MEIERRELLRYLGYKGQEINSELEDKISLAISICKKEAQPIHILRKYTLDFENRELKGTGLKLTGESIWKHLSGCSDVYMVAATLGFNLEKRTNRAFIDDATLAVLLDSAATCLIENYLDEIEKNIPEELTSRYSCGYGDWDIQQQKDICKLLDTQKQIGLFVNDACMLTPQKSVTAIMGIKK